MNFRATLGPDFAAAYTKKEYTDHTSKINVSERVKAYPLHYQIAVGVGTEACLGFAKKHRAHLVTKDSKLWDLTALMLAIVLERADLVKGLVPLMAVADLPTKDLFGFNCLHLSAIFLPGSVELFLEREMDPKTLTPLYGSYEDLMVLAGHRPATVPVCRLQVMDEKGELVDGNALSTPDLKRLTGRVTLREVPLYDSRESRMILWQRAHPKCYRLDLRSKIDFEAMAAVYEESAPRMVVKLSEPLKQLHPIIALTCRSLGLFAGQEISAFEKVAAYGGRCTLKGDGEYFFRMYNGQDVGGLAPFVNCGFPNTMYVAHPYKGSEQHDLISVCRLAKEEEILVSYGFPFPPLCFGRQVLLGAQEMKAFFLKFKTQKEEFEKPELIPSFRIFLFRKL